MPKAVEHQLNAFIPSSIVVHTIIKRVLKILTLSRTFPPHNLLHQLLILRFCNFSPVPFSAGICHFLFLFITFHDPNNSYNNDCKNNQPCNSKESASHVIHLVYHTLLSTLYFVYAIPIIQCNTAFFNTFPFYAHIELSKFPLLSITSSVLLYYNIERLILGVILFCSELTISESLLT